MEKPPSPGTISEWLENRADEISREKVQNHLKTRAHELLVKIRQNPWLLQGICLVSVVHIVEEILGISTAVFLELLKALFWVAIIHQEID